jgi:hypothetical protein
MFWMRGSHFILLPKTVSDGTIRKSLQTISAPQSPCSLCGCVLTVGTRRSRCNNCFVEYCKACSAERWNDKCWCKRCNSHMIYHKLVKPTDDGQLERLSDVIARKIRHDIGINAELPNCGFGAG